MKIQLSKMNMMNEKSASVTSFQCKRENTMRMQVYLLMPSWQQRNNPVNSYILCRAIPLIYVDPELLETAPRLNLGEITGNESSSNLKRRFSSLPE